MERKLIPSLSSDKIRQLWRDPKFSGSFSGLVNFQTALKFEKNINISRKKLYDILSKDRNYLLEMRKIKKRIKRRPMNIHGYCVLWQCDIGQLFRHGEYSAFLLCVDVFSKRLFCRPLKSKKAENVEKAFTSIFLEAGMKPEKIETDQGSEFQNERQFFKKQKIFFKIKIGINKAR